MIGLPLTMAGGDGPRTQSVRQFARNVLALRDMPVASRMRLSKTFPPLACGVPVVYAGYGESADLVRDNDCGVVVKPEAPDVLAEAIERLADDPAARARMSANGPKLIERELSWAAIVKNWLAELKVEG